MRRIVIVAVVAIALPALDSSNLAACGDKSLSAGGIRMQRALAARYPAAVLMYSPAASRLQAASDELHLQETLRKVGHKYREVSTLGDLQQAINTGQYNIVLADLADVPQVQQHLEPSAARVPVVAVVYRLTKAETAEAAKMCRFVIRAPSHAAQYLRVITDAVRLKSSTPRKV